MVMFNKNFKYDLEFGEIREQRVADILRHQKIEVKTERGIWQSTGNIAIEIAWRNKPSGLATTEAAYWLHVLERDGEEFCSFLFTVAALKHRINELQHHKKIRIVMGGDDNQSKLVLLPILELFNLKEA